MIIYSDEPEKLKTIIGELFLHKDQISVSEETKNWLTKVQVEPIEVRPPEKERVIKRIVGYLENFMLKKIKQGFKAGSFSGTRSPNQATLDIAIWKLKDDVYVTKDDYVKVTLLVVEHTER